MSNIAHTVVITLLSGMAALLAANRIAFAQAGSTGGTIGKTDKSASGANEDSSKNRPPSHKRKDVDARRPQTSGCRNIAGSWAWRSMAHFDVIFTTNGRGTAANGLKAEWTCSDGMYVLHWANGMVDHMALSSDGTRLSGRGGLGDAISAERK